MSPLDGVGIMHIQGWEELLMAVFTDYIHQHAQIFINIILSMRIRTFLVASQAFEYYLNPLALNFEWFLERSAVNILGIIQQQLKTIIDCVDLVFCSPCHLYCVVHVPFICVEVGITSQEI